jgi:uncharacterized tellurite resistance protein B-like protein
LFPEPNPEPATQQPGAASGVVMQPSLSPRSGFQLLLEGGIDYWYFDKTNVVNYLGPIALLESEQSGDFILQTTSGQRFQIVLTAKQVAEFRALGGTLKSDSDSRPREQATIRSGIQSTARGLFFWFQKLDNTITRVGPIVRLTQMQNGDCQILTRDGSHRHRLDSDDLAQFQQLGGIVNHAPSPPIPESRDTKVSPRTDEIENSAARNESKTNAAKLQLQSRTLQWYGASRPVTFGSYRFEAPLTYFSNRIPPEEEASCIDITLPVGKPLVEPRGALGYWPAYNRITPDQRANYLTWLAGGRTANLDDIGYALLFFCGLERRVLLENRDATLVAQEVVRLLHRYTFSGSFTGYLSRFLAYAIARNGLENVKQDWFDHIFEKRSIQPSEEIVALALAWHLKQNRPLSLGWAKRIAKEHPQASRSVVVQRVPEQFDALFEKKFRSRFGDGFLVRAAARDRILDYKQPASPSLQNLCNRDSAFCRPLSIPNVLGLQSQFSPLVAIWEECIEELKPLSRQIAKGTEGNSRTVWELLPDDLKAQAEHPDTPKWHAVVAENTSEDGHVIAPISKLARLLGLEERRKFTTTQSEAIAQTAEDVGYCIEPDFRMTKAPYSLDDVVALFHSEGDCKPTADNRYLGAALMLEMGMAVAAADGVISEEEAIRVGRFLESQFVLDQGEGNRLKQLERVFLRHHPALSRVSKRLLKSLSQSQREQLGRFLFGVAAADGRINAMTLKALRSAYRAIDVNLVQLDSLLEELRTTSQPNGTNHGVRSTDLRLQSLTSETLLDQDRIREIMAETQALGEILGQVFAQEEDEETEESPGVPTNVNGGTEFLPAKPGCFLGLQERFRALAADLLMCDQWPPAEFENLVRGRDLMPQDALTRINEWAEENLGDFFIEGELEGSEPLLIRRDLIREEA